MGRWAASEQDTDKLKDGIIAVYNRKTPPLVWWGGCMFFLLDVHECFSNFMDALNDTLTLDRTWSF